MSFQNRARKTFTDQSRGIRQGFQFHMNRECMGKIKREDLLES